MNKNKIEILSGNYIAGFVDGEGCFDLQFRRDVRHERINKPVYYGWRYQFVIVTRKDDEELLRKIQKTFNCGSINFARGDQTRYSVQDITHLYNIILPFFKKYPLSGKKKKDFELWAEAIEIIYQNKGKFLKKWSKENFLRVIEIQKSMQEYKFKRPQGYKWLSIAESVVETLK